MRMRRTNAKDEVAATASSHSKNNAIATKLVPHACKYTASVQLHAAI
jgi:hypothetical protein